MPPFARRLRNISPLPSSFVTRLPHVPSYVDIPFLATQRVPTTLFLPFFSFSSSALLSLRTMLTRYIRPPIVGPVLVLHAVSYGLCRPHIACDFPPPYTVSSLSVSTHPLFLHALLVSRWMYRSIPYTLVLCIQSVACHRDPCGRMSARRWRGCNSSSATVRIRHCRVDNGSQSTRANRAGSVHSNALA